MKIASQCINWLLFNEFKNQQEVMGHSISFGLHSTRWKGNQFMKRRKKGKKKARKIKSKFLVVSIKILFQLSFLSQFKM